MKLKLICLIVFSVRLQVLNETLNPVWNQTFDFVVEDALHELLIFEIYDHDTIGKVIYKLLILGNPISSKKNILLQGLIPLVH